MLPTMHLEPDEWAEINNVRPNHRELISRVINWPRVENIACTDVATLDRVRLSAVHFRNAAEQIRNASYSFGQALATRKFYFDRSEHNRDSLAAWGDWKSRFFAEYSAFLLYSVGEHCLQGLLDLFADRTNEKRAGKRKGEGKGYKLEKVTRAFEIDLPNDPVTTALQTYKASENREKVYLYRNGWVHENPQRIESILYNPPHLTEAQITQPELPPGMHVFPSYSAPPDYTWDEFVDILRNCLTSTLDILTTSAERWEAEYQRLCHEHNSIADFFGTGDAAEGHDE